MHQRNSAGRVSFKISNLHHSRGLIPRKPRRNCESTVGEFMKFLSLPIKKHERARLLEQGIPAGRRYRVLPDRAKFPASAIKIRVMSEPFKRTLHGTHVFCPVDHAIAVAKSVPGRCAAGEEYRRQDQYQANNLRRVVLANSHMKSVRIQPTLSGSRMAPVGCAVQSSVKNAKSASTFPKLKLELRTKAADCAASREMLRISR